MLNLWRSFSGANSGYQSYQSADAVEKRCREISTTAIQFDFALPGQEKALLETVVGFVRGPNYNTPALRLTIAEIVVFLMTTVQTLQNFNKQISSSDKSVPTPAPPVTNIQQIAVLLDQAWANSLANRLDFDTILKFQQLAKATPVEQLRELIKTDISRMMILLYCPQFTVVCHDLKVFDAATVAVIKQRLDRINAIMPLVVSN